jgi:hypothetical protein
MFRDPSEFSPLVYLQQAAVQIQDYSELNQSAADVATASPEFHAPCPDISYDSIFFTLIIKQKKKQIHSMVGVRERTIPTERPPLVGEVSANF